MAKGKRGITLANAISVDDDEATSETAPDDDTVLDADTVSNPGETTLTEDINGNAFLPGTEPVVDAKLVELIKELKTVETERRDLQRRETQLRADTLERMIILDITEYRVGGFVATISQTQKVKVQVPKTNDGDF